MPSVLDLITVAIQQKMIVTAMYQGLVKGCVRTSCGYKIKGGGQELNLCSFVLSVCREEQKWLTSGRKMEMYSP